MKVLWFALTPCNGANYMGNKGVVAGWLSSLENEIKKNVDIELSVCFINSVAVDNFVYEGVNYFPVNRKWDGSFFKKLVKIWKWGSPFLDRDLIDDLVSIVDQVKPDIVHIHGTEECFGLIQDKITVPTVISIQGLLAPYREKLFSGIPYIDIKKNESFYEFLTFKDIQHRVITFDRTVKREICILKNAKHIIGRTAWDKRVTRVLAPNSKYYLGNEVLRGSFYTKKWDKESFNKRLTIITTMSGGVYKGLETVLKTAQLLMALEVNFEWVVVGLSGKENFPNLVKNYLKDDYDKNSIRFVGLMNDEDLAVELCKSDIFCQVSHIENSPNSLCEAMLVGMPIIASFVGGTDSILAHEMEGILVQDGDPYSYAGTIIELGNDFERSKHIAFLARERALARHKPSFIANEYIDIYQNILYNE
jgi:glycosyltransferase involved in cell wall biosynthesis